ncbi:protein DpdD [Sorangium sp. So ce281]|uniref:protein DpdD n=1 Tax=unclassified Sorangium TaxID=2621164 RepID=UPI003F60D5C1
MSFEHQFFGPGNRLRWEAIQRKTLPAEVYERLGPFLEELGRDPEMVILPRVRDDGSVAWYVLCASTHVARIARNELRAFLGPSYSDFEGRPTFLDARDPVEAAVLDRCGSNAFRLEVPDERLFTAARERLRLVLRLRAERPSRHGQRLRATGRILRDFEYALLSHDGAAASEHIAELRSTGRLDTANLLFLEVRRLASLGMWDAILALPELGVLVELRRPRRVTEALVQAVYNGLLHEFEMRAYPVGAVQRFRAEVLPRFRGLYRARAGLSGHEVEASFLLLAIASDPPRPELVDTILSAQPESAPTRAYLASIAALLPGRAPASIVAGALQYARDVFAHGDVDGAYESALALPPSFERCALLLRCAWEIGTLATTRVALAAVEDLSTSERERLDHNAVLSRIHGALAASAASPPSAPPTTTVVSQPSCEVPSSWPAWLRGLQAAERWRTAVAIADAAGREWSFAHFAADPEQVEYTAELLLAELPEWGQAALRDALPYLLEFFLSEGPDTRLAPVYDSLFLLLAVDDHVSIAQLRALVRVADAKLQLGLTVADYREIISQLMRAIEAIGSPSSADLALEVADLLVTVPCLDPAARQHFIIQVAGLFQRWYRRIDAAHWTLLRNLADELGVADAVPRIDANDAAREEGSCWSALRGARIAVYSLQESVLRRVKSTLQALCADATVHCFHDKVGGSPALRTAASTADLFVVAAAVAKHAATDFIEANRSRTSVTLYACGRGSASILEAIRDHLHKTSSSSS